MTLTKRIAAIEAKAGLNDLPPYLPVLVTREGDAALALRQAVSNGFTQEHRDQGCVAVIHLVGVKPTREVC